MRSLRTRTVFWALVPTVLVLVIVAVIALFSYERVVREVVQEWNAELTRISAARLSEGLGQHGRILQTIAADRDVRSLEPARMEAALEQAQAQPDVFDPGVVVYDSAGNALRSVPPDGERTGAGFPVPAVFERLQGASQPVFSDVFRDDVSGRYAVLVAVPILSADGGFGGALVGIAEVNPCALSHLTSRGGGDHAHGPVPG